MKHNKVETQHFSRQQWKIVKQFNMLFLIILKIFMTMIQMFISHDLCQKNGLMSDDAKTAQKIKKIL